MHEVELAIPLVAMDGAPPTAVVQYRLEQPTAAVSN